MTDTSATEQPSPSDQLATRKKDAELIFASLKPTAIEVLGQLFLHGPKWDGYVVSKSGRDVLHEQGLIDRGFGWQWLNRKGMEVAVHAPWENWFEGRARRKANTTTG